MTDTCQELTSWVSLALSVIALILNWRTEKYQHLSPAKLEWQRPMVFSLDDERTSPEHRRRPAIAIALTIHNAGAQPGIVWDTAVVVTRLGDLSDKATFQAGKFGSDPKYVTVFDIEEHALPTTPIVVDGHQTKTVIVQFEQRSNNHWCWRPGAYGTKVYSLGNNGQWTEKTSFEFTLTDECMDGQSQPARVTPCQRWTRAVLDDRDALIERS